MSAKRNLTGLRFSRLLVLNEAGISKHQKSLFRCRCDCGNETIVVGGNLTSGGTKSCGCWKPEAVRIARTTHGLSSHSAYKRYGNMIARCENPENDEYHNYGARGIKVCARWKDSIKSFIDDMGVPPSDSHTIDRIDNDGDYTPENCRWATKTDQNINRRVTHWLTFNGQTKCETEWCRSLGLKKFGVSARLIRGWSLEKALTTPFIEKGKYPRHSDEYRYA